MDDPGMPLWSESDESDRDAQNVSHGKRVATEQKQLEEKAHDPELVSLKQKLDEVIEKVENFRGIEFMISAKMMNEIRDTLGGIATLATKSFTNSSPYREICKHFLQRTGSTSEASFWALAIHVVAPDQGLSKVWHKHKTERDILEAIVNIIRTIAYSGCPSKELLAVPYTVKHSLIDYECKLARNPCGSDVMGDVDIRITRQIFSRT
ncbi:hypothetical protein CkaCkLH20_06573 [Colletotrichum karsti]|uniref:Uncharacterized protein n=1 Tax=Colletotrichum karsti TaxID=1095194 RepID=A0A9P6I5I5_9PEZI|nr:uncharacterized protein CkaCkLH20_06573 [Colletotrichum karsti]KAF9876127.1 hypothetical protein CkaCkLH20_06573 [Colletotrichum karsti]